MVESEGVGNVVTVDRPLLTFKIGVLGCAPLDLPRRLAEVYDAKFFASDSIRKERIDARDAQGMPPAKAQKVDTRGIQGTLVARARPLLAAGEDVVLDAFFLTPNSRQVPLELARTTGTLSVALWINTSPETALERVQQWTEEGSFVVPVSRWDIPPVQAARAMMKQVKRPADVEGIDYVFNLNGDTDTDGILDQFDASLERFGLADRYEIVEEGDG